VGLETEASENLCIPTFLQNCPEVGGVAQVVQCLPSKPEALSSNPSAILLPSIKARTAQRLSLWRGKP
jgi:hypothetical protein